MYLKGDGDMAYIALYRKWRPDSFKNLVGQEHVSRTLSNAITTGHVGHAYLFSGPRGTGKTSTAKILAKSLNCEKGPTLEPCGVCESCRKISDGTSMDVYEIDAASNRGIDEIRDLRETVQYAPVLGRYKIYIIDEVHMLTTEAFNALLKTLEEPPSHVMFILATTEAHKVPPTIQSRCQRYDFKRITVEDILGRLQLVTTEMQIEAEEAALRMIALRADGGMRDALSILDQCTAISEGKLTLERVQQLLGLIGREWIGKLVSAIASHDANAVLETVAKLLEEGKDLQQLLTELSSHFRSLMIFQATDSIDSAGFYQDAVEMARTQSKQFTQQQMMSILRRLHEAMSEVKWSPQPRISVEAVLLELCQGRYDAGDMQGSFDVKVQQSSIPVAQSGVDAGRMARLEAKLEQLMSMVEQLKSSESTATVSSLKPQQADYGTTMGNTVQASNEQLSRPVPKTTGQKTASTGKVNLREAWGKLIADSDDNSIDMSYVRQAELSKVEDDVLYLLVASDFIRDSIIRRRKAKIEKLLQEMTGISVALDISSRENGKVSRPKLLPQRKEKKVEEPPVDTVMTDRIKGKPVNIETLPESTKAALSSALDAFPGDVMEMSEAGDLSDEFQAPPPTDDDYFEMDTQDDEDIPLPDHEN